MTPFSKALRASPIRSVGMTLIELMIVVAVIAILASIGIPSYREYIIRANRSAAQQFMLSIASRQEQYRLDRRSYASTIGGAGTDCALGLTEPPELATRYTFSISHTGASCSATTTATDYTITATAIPGGPQASDGNLTLDHLGSKAPADKWKR